MDWAAFYGAGSQNRQFRSTCTPTIPKLEKKENITHLETVGLCPAKYFMILQSNIHGFLSIVTTIIIHFYSGGIAKS